jgi:hypothetical protein
LPTEDKPIEQLSKEERQARASAREFHEKTKNAPIRVWFPGDEYGDGRSIGREVRGFGDHVADLFASFRRGN